MNAAGMKLLKEFEGFETDAYQDIVGVWTIGYGFTDNVRPGDKITRAAADKYLLKELKSYERAVKSACTLAPNENQLAAMTCLAWNIGKAGFKGSTVVKAHNRGDFTETARAFGLWKKAGGKVVKGLVRRRAAEAALYLTPVKDVEPESMPQAVEEERPMTQSKLVTGGTITAGVSGLSVAAQVAGDVGSIRDSFGPWLPYILMIAAVIGVGAGLFIVWERFQQRKRGEA
jgi:lysozyme